MAGMPISPGSYAPNVRVLMVESDPGAASTIQRACERSSLSVQLCRAASGEECLGLLRRAASDADTGAAGFPDIVLLSSDLADMTGEDVLRALEEDLGLKHLPSVVLLAASAAERESLRRQHLPCHAFLVKSDRPEELGRRLDGAFRMWFLMPRLAAF